MYKHKSLTWSILICFSAQGSCFCKRHFTLRRQVGSQKSKGTTYRILSFLDILEDSNLVIVNVATKRFYSRVERQICGECEWGFKPHAVQYRYQCSISWAENKLWVVLFLTSVWYTFKRASKSGFLLQKGKFSFIGAHMPN